MLQVGTFKFVGRFLNILWIWINENHQAVEIEMVYSLASFIYVYIGTICVLDQ